MNFRKIIRLLEYSLVIYWIYNTATDPTNYFMNAFYIVTILIVINVVYYSFEHFWLVKKKKAILIQARRKVFSPDQIINIIITIIILYVLYTITDTSAGRAGLIGGFIVTILIILRSFIIPEQQASIVINSDKILFDELLTKDIFINEIQAARMDDAKYNIVLQTAEGKKRLLRLNKKYYNKNKSKLEGVVRFLNGDQTKSILIDQN